MSLRAHGTKTQDYRDALFECDYSGCRGIVVVVIGMCVLRFWFRVFVGVAMVADAGCLCSDVHVL